MTGFIIFVIGLAALAFLFALPDGIVLNVWVGTGFWLAVASLVVALIGLSLMLGSLIGRYV